MVQPANRRIVTDDRLAIKAVPRRSVQSPGFWRTTTTLNGQLFVGHDTTAAVTFWVNTSNLFISTDNGDTLSSGKGLPSGVTNGFTIYRVVRYKALWVMIASDASDSNKYKIYACTAVTGNTALTWTAVKTLAINSTNISGALGVSSDGNTLLASEYTGTPNITGGPSIYKTTDTSAVTWSTVDTRASARHFHGVWEDPYNTGTWYALLGDATTTPVLKSTNNGASFSSVSSVGLGWDGVQMSFSPNYIWCTGDVVSAINVAPFYVMDRTTLTPQIGCSSSPMSIPVTNLGVFTTGATATSGNNFIGMGSFEQPITVDDIGSTITVKKNSDSSLVVPSGTQITDVVSPTIYMSNTCTQTSTAITYVVNRNERYYPVSLYGTVDPATETFYLVADNAGANPLGLAYRVGLFTCTTVFGPLTWVDNLVTASRLVEVVGTELITSNHHRPALTVAQAV